MVTLTVYVHRDMKEKIVELVSGSFLLYLKKDETWGGVHAWQRLCPHFQT